MSAVRWAWIGLVAAGVVWESLFAPSVVGWGSHTQPAFQSLGYSPGDLPVTEQVADEVISLPMYPELPAEQQVYVVDAIREFYDRIE